MVERPIRSLATAFVVLLAALAPVGLDAAGLQLLQAAAHSGNSGLRVSVETDCTGPHERQVNGYDLQYISTFQACESLTSGNTTVASSGNATFIAGRTVVLGDGFSVQSGGRLTVTIDPDRLPHSRLTDASLDQEIHYAAGFYVNFDRLTLAPGQRFELLTGDNVHGTRWFTLAVQRNGSLGENRLVLETRDNAGASYTTAGNQEVPVSAGWHWVSIDWKAARGGKRDGFLRLYLGAAYQVGFERLASSGGRVSTVRMGAIDIPGSDCGSFDLDQFVSRMAGPVKPPA